MAEYPDLTVADLAEYASRPVVSFSASYINNVAIPQAILLFKFATCISVWPDNAQDAALCRFAILEMTRKLDFENKYEEAMASPFNNENIGSYSYSKSYSRTAAKIAQGKPTDLQFFDLAVQKLGICELTDPVITGGGIDVFTHGYMGQDQPNNRMFLSPQDLNQSRMWGFDFGVLPYEWIPGGEYIEKDSSE